METFSALLAHLCGEFTSPVNSPYKIQWRGVLIFSLICAWINGWVNIREAGHLRHHRALYDVTVIREAPDYCSCCIWQISKQWIVQHLFIVHSLQWCHNDRDGFSNRQRLHCLLKHLFGRKSKKTSKLRVIGLYVRGIHRWSLNSPHKRTVTRKMFPFDDVIMFLFI